MEDSWLGLSVLHGLAGVTDGVTDNWVRCVAISWDIMKNSED